MIEKYLKSQTEGFSRVPDALARYCTGRLSVLLNQSEHESAHLPAILDPHCGTGQFLLYLCEGMSRVFRSPGQETNTGSMMTGSSPYYQDAAEKERLLYSLYGLDPDPSKAESTRFVLFLWLNRHIYDGTYLNRQAEAFFGGRHRLSDTIRCSQVLFAPDFFTDLTRAWLGPERAEKIHTFDLDREFPEIAEQGGFDAVTGNFISSSHRLSRSVREYLQGHFVTYDPGADCSVYRLEKSVQLLKKRGICSAVHNCGWTGASCAGRLRDHISSMQIIEMTEIAKQSGEEGREQDSGILIFSKEPPSNDVIAAKVTFGTCRNIFRQAHSMRNMIQHPGRGTGGWSFRDPRYISLKQAITRHGIPLERYVMGELFHGINRDAAGLVVAFPENYVIPSSLSRYLELLPFVKGKTLGAYSPVITSAKIPVPVRDLDMKKIEHILHQLNACGLTREDCTQSHLPGPEEFMSAIPLIRKYAGMKDKILIPLEGSWPACTFDQTGGIPDDTILFIPHRDLYLLAFLNSALSEFLMTLKTCSELSKKGCISPQWLHRLPVHVPDSSDEKELHLHDRISLLAERIIGLTSVRVPDADDRIACEIDARIRDAKSEINRCFYALYGFSEREIEIVERFCSS